MSDLSKRIVVRVTGEQLAYIEQAAADEGMDNATFVRVVIDRLSKGRAPLISMMQSGSEPPRRYAPQPNDDPAAAAPLGDASDILAERAAQVEANLPEPEQAVAPHNGAAIPLRRMPRQVYNPGRN